MSDNHQIYFAPIQESTDYIYRNAHARYFGGIDKYFSPYILRQNDGSVKKSHLRDINLENNRLIPLVPQILAGNTDDFVYLVKILQDNEYKEVNWNMGCPYPMVTNKGLGSGLLPYPDKIKSILDEALPQLKVKISVKLRAGLLSHDEIFKVIEVLNEFPLSEIILHPRTGKQLYRENPDWETFEKVIPISGHHLIYNGDIENLDDFDLITRKFSGNTTWMIGRGILANPFLPSLLKGKAPFSKNDRIQVLRNFHDDVFAVYSQMLSGPSHQLMRMEKFWSFFCHSFPNPHKSFKRIKKAINISKYDIAVNENFQSFRYDEED